MAPAPEGGRRELILNRENDDEPLPTQQGAADHPLTQGGGNEPPPTRKGREKTRVVSQILQSTRKIWKNELIAIFGLTSAITKTDEISEPKQAQEKRSSDQYSTSMQYTVLGKIHGKEVYLVPPQDAALLLEDRISPKLRKQLKQHNALEGVGQLANHTCCDIHWNANLEVAAIDHYEETDTEPMGILRARHDTRFLSYMWWL